MKKTIKYLLALLAVTSVSAVSFTPLGQNVIAKEINHKEAAPASYYSSVDTSSGEKLIKSLTSIISNGHKAQGYDALFRCYKTSDVKPGTNEIWDMYSNCKFDVDKDHGASYKNEGDIYNREHTVPQSWFNKANPMVCDAHHIFPTDGKVNGIRSSFLHGEVKPGTATYTSTNGCQLGSSASSLYSGKVFEVPDEYKGDFARTYFYMATRYSSQVGSWGGDANKVFKGSFPYLTNYSIDMYTKWDAMDPVSEKEINRNEAVYKFQGNRNPFIDHPEYVAMIWPSEYNQNVEVDETKVDEVIAKISALPQASAITLNDKEAINAANSAYAALNYKEKQAVTNYSTLQAALNKLAELEAPVTPTPGPNPNPNPVDVDGDKVDITFSGVTTSSYEKDKSFSIGNYGFKANVCYAESGGNNGTFVRIGAKGNNVPDLQSKFGISGKGGSLEMTFDVNNSKGVTFTVGGQMTGSKVEKWTILVSTDGGNTWSQVANGTSISGSVSAALSSTASSARFALVIQGKVDGSNGPRLDLTSMSIIIEGDNPQPTINQENVDAVIDLIDELPLLENLVLADEDDVNAIVELYNELSTAEKALVTNYSDLTAAVAKINELKGTTPGPIVENYALTVAEALKIVKGLESGASTSELYTVTGIISGNVRDLNPQFGDASFEMNDGTGESLYAYGLTDGESKAKFTSSSFSAKIGVGKQVTVVGKLLKYVDKKGTVKLEITNGYVADKVVPTKPVEPTVSLKGVKTNKLLSVSYDIYNSVISNVKVSTVITSHITKSEYNLKSVEYGVIYAEKSKVENEYNLIKAAYDVENTDYKYAKATVTTENGEFAVKATLDLDMDTEYVAVVVCIQNDALVFANQTTVNVSDMISYYLTNNLISDTEQVAVLNTLLN